MKIANPREKNKRGIDFETCLYEDIQKLIIKKKKKKKKKYEEIEKVKGKKFKKNLSEKIGP